jgi:hypothetical protein
LSLTEYTASGMPGGLTALEYQLLAPDSSLAIDWTSIPATQIGSADAYGNFSYKMDVPQPSPSFTSGFISFRVTATPSTQTSYTTISFSSIAVTQPFINHIGTLTQTLSDQFDVDLSLALGDEVSCSGADGDTYSAASRRASTARAIREYSRYRSRLRRYGTADLFQQSSTGDTAILVVGGTFLNGDKITLDSGSAYSETATVANVTTAVNFAGTPVQTLSVCQINLSAPLLYSHSSGILVSRAMPGLSIVSGQDTYNLPTDWIEPEQTSFDVAVGAKASYVHQTSFYDATFMFEALLSGANENDTSNYSVGNMITGEWPFSGDPNDNPNGFSPLSGPTGCGVTVWRFYKGIPARLRIMPVPIQDALIDFDYFGSHTLSSIPSDDFSAVMAYACYSARMSRASAMSSQSDIKIGDVSKMRVVGAKSLLDLAAADLLEFNRRIQNTAVMISG